MFDPRDVRVPMSHTNLVFRDPIDVFRGLIRNYTGIISVGGLPSHSYTAYLGLLSDPYVGIKWTL